MKNPDGVGGFDVSMGDVLDLPQTVLQTIRRSYQCDARRKEAYLDTYVHHHPWPSWRRITEVLTRFRFHQQAVDVESTYVQGMLHQQEYLSFPTLVFNSNLTQAHHEVGRLDDPDMPI